MLAIAVPPRRAAFGLTEAFEDMRQEIRVDALAGVAHRKGNVGADAT